jgi:hypothetical protein
MRLDGHKLSLFEDLVYKALSQIKQAPEKFSTSVGEPGIGWIIAGLSWTKDRATINSMIKTERERRHILEEVVLPSVPRGERLRVPVVRDLNIDFEKVIKNLHSIISPLEMQIIAVFQDFLDSIAGKACPDVKDNQTLVKTVTAQAARYGMALLCRDERQARDGTPIGDGQFHPVRLRCSKPHIGTGTFEARALGRDAPIIYSRPLHPRLVAWFGPID